MAMIEAGSSRAASAFAPAGSAGSARVRAGLLRASRFAVGSAILWLAFEAGTFLSESLRLPVPGNLLGMLILLALLFSGAVRPAHIEEAANLGLKHLTLFFVPYAVGLMTLRTVSAPAAAVIVAALLASILTGMAAAGRAAQWAERRRLSNGAAAGRTVAGNEA